MAAAATAIAEYRRIIGVDPAGTAVLPAQPPRPLMPSGRSVPGPVTDRWQRVPDPPATISRLGSRFAPRPADDGRPTTGVVAGRPESVRSGGDDRSIADDLEIRRLRDGTPPDPVYRHVEGKVAAWMRRDGVESANLAIDNTTCGSNERDRTAPFSCERLLPSILPPLARLTIWSTRDGGRTWWRADFIGTGERIRR